MSLTDAEILELEQLLKDREIDLKFDALRNPEKFDGSPNYIALHKAVVSQKWGNGENGAPKLEAGYAGFCLEGSSRSTKTWAGVDLIIWLCTEHHKHESVKINIYRETYNEFKDTLYEDFKRRLDDYGLPNKFHTALEVKSFRIGKSTVNFLGDGKHGGGCDYAFFNEAMMIKREVFDQVEMRCRRFWWMDWNPSFTTHWIFNNVLNRKDVGYLRTTFKNNKHISAGELNKILSYEPWLPDSYYIDNDVIMYDGSPVSEKNQPPPHPTNVINGTADEFMWSVYGLGLRGALKGVIYPNVTWIDAFPVDVAKTVGMDFGFTTDPTAFGYYGRRGNNIYWQPLFYSPTPSVDSCEEALIACGISQYVPITADSSDKYTSDTNGSFQMVRDLLYRGWEIMKVSKTKSVMYWIGDTKRYKLHIVKSPNPEIQKAMITEQQNYKMKEVQGILINQPIDKHDHLWNAMRYAHMSHDINSISETTN